MKALAISKGCKVLGNTAYHPKTGKFYLVEPMRGKRLGQELTGTDDSGYIILWFGSRAVRGHTLAWRIMTGEWPTLVIDHKDRIKINNKWCNLRHVTQQENMLNASHMLGKSGVRGVRFRANGWEARLTRMYKEQYKRFPPTEEGKQDAIAWYKEMVDHSRELTCRS